MRDFLDKVPTYANAEDGYYIDEASVQRGRIGMYARKPRTFTDAKYAWDCVSDQLYERHNWNAATSIYRGIIEPTTGGLIGGFYSGAYAAIATANDFLASIAPLDESLLVDIPKDRYLAEARFFKAYYYFYLTEVFGGVPLYKERPATLDGYNVKQSTKQEIIDYILSDLDIAIEHLPEERYTGYITKGAAQALKARIFLHNERWQEAADEALKVINSGIFSLDNDYFGISIKSGQALSNEIIFSYQFQYPVSWS